MESYWNNMNLKTITINILPIIGLYSLMVLPKVDYGQVLGIMVARESEVVSPEIVPTPTPMVSIVETVPTPTPVTPKDTDTPKDSPQTLPGVVVCNTGSWDQQISCWVVKYATKYTNNVYERSVMIAKLHFLLSKEAKHGNVKTCGDNSKACGPLQFWAQTWTRMRTQMLKAGLITEIGDRNNMEQAIETTAWAIANGREKEWGPLLRNEIKI